ncbi:hypothetical protein JOF56_009160 [Kibdelosporangium banguiense]|uniref:Integral membrane protein n=1 Tax=Kibdelosporangium banguiense TaxID=1365924 RepID=A0ABS4TXT2_9PSEU|nr:DUF6069 family protein [Kibdelosporangium banguiense]MBP2328775.1 hypothetical protein [Kibdelosporangium banguiense]
MADYDGGARYGAARRPGVNAARLWASGLATAVVAALLAVVGILIARGVVEVAVLAPKGEGVWGNANTFTYAMLSALAALLATGMMHLLILAVAAPRQFFTWIMVLMTLIAVVLPLTLTVEIGGKIATAVINLAIGLAITIVLNTVAASARTVRAGRPNDAPTRQWDQPPDNY